MMMKNRSLKRIGRRPSWIFKIKIFTGGALERHVSRHLSHFEEIDHTVAAIAIFRMKCKNSLDDRA